MALSEQDRDTIELIASRIAAKMDDSHAVQRQKMADVITAGVQEMIVHHQETCPHGRKIRDSRWFMAGASCVVLILVKDAAAAAGWLLKALSGI